MSMVNRRQNNRSSDMVIVGLIARLLIVGGPVFALIVPGGAHHPAPMAIFVFGIAVYVKASEMRLQKQIDEIRNQRRQSAEKE